MAQDEPTAQVDSTEANGTTEPVAKKAKMLDAQDANVSTSSAEGSNQGSQEEGSQEATSQNNEGPTDAEIIAAVDAIEGAEADHNKLEDLKSFEICKIEQKYIEMQQPFFEKRQAAINTIPDFWYRAFINHPQLGCLVDEHDDDCFSYLKKIVVNSKTHDLQCEDADSMPYVKTFNHSILFEFSPNPYFENEQLEKKFYQVMDDISSESTEIIWKSPETNLIQLSRDRLKTMKNGNTKPNPEGDNKPNKAENFSVEEDQVESFFAWFHDNEEAGNDETADLIKDDLWMHALVSYLDDADDDEGEDDEEEDGGEIDLEGESED